MRSYRYLVFSLALISLCLSPAVAFNYRLDARQNDPQSSGSPAPSTTAAQPSSTGDASPIPSSISDKAAATSSHHEASSKPISTGDSNSFSISVTPTDSIQAPSTSVTYVAAPSATNGTASNLGNPLPIHPKLTPAMGVTGVILLLSGAVYTVIGIKNKMLYIFFSACYLTSLATTVLIVYLMSPPVKDAVQGAFFVAALFSGLIFGALSLIFTDITDGLGCLLGGYCLSMWFLTLKEGGLIANNTGRAIFIAGMSVAGFSLSFSHYTRTYGLIVCISFAGATATVLGIDCLSRAGLKEFWLYLWNLNTNTFPLNTNTYPVTRGIRVEVAFIILIFLLGIMSQLKLWKLVKERRERGAVTRMERQENQEREEEERGRRIENDFARERAQWEAEYGDKGMAHTDSGLGSSNDSNAKTSVSVKERRSDSVEMMDMSRSKEIDQSKLMSRDSSKGGTGTVVTVGVMQDDNIQQIDSNGNVIPPSPTTARNSALHSSANSSARASTEMRPAEEGDESRLTSARTSLRSSVPPPPIVVPLPFTIPSGDVSDRDDRASVSTVPESLPPKKRGSKTFSAISNRLSMNRLSSNPSTSEEVLIPHVEDDRASSVAATMDDMDEDGLSLPELSRSNSPLGEGFQLNFDTHLEGAAFGETEKQVTKVEEPTKSLESPTTSGPEKETTGKSSKRQSLTTSTDPKPGDTKSKRTSTSSRRRSGASVVNEDEGRTRRRSKSLQSIAQSEGSESHLESLAEVLPEKLSKVVLSYRTNEWAKHLEVADKPELDELEQPPSPGIQVKMGLPEATTPPKLVEKRQSLSVSNPPVSNIQASSPQLAGQSFETSYQTSNTNPYRQPNVNRSTSSVSKYSTNDSTPNLLSRNPSTVTVNTIPSIQIPSQYSGGPGTMSRSSSAAKLRGRNSSMPLMNQTLVESPIEEESANMPFATSPMPGNNIMGRRETLARNNTAPIAYTPHSSVPNLNIVAATDAGSTRATQLHSADTDNLSLTERKQLIDQENMTLAQRKTLIQNLQPSTQQRRQGTWPLAEQPPLQNFDSHQPKRDSRQDHGKREARLATWRESIRQEMAPQLPVASEEDKRMAMIRERERLEMEKQQHAMAANVRDTMFDNMMRRGDMLDAHREALRRMQASANKNA